MGSYFPSLVACFLVVNAVVAYPVDPAASFTATIQTIPIALHFENLTVYHRLYEGIGTGTLPVSSFKGFIQQDDLYVQNYLDNFGIMASRELDPERANYLQSIANDQLIWTKFFATQYEEFKFKNTSQIMPVTLDYAAAERVSSKYEQLGIALAAATPCFTVWRKIAARLEQLSAGNLETNPYRSFIEAIKSGSSGRNFTDFVDGYYARLNASVPKDQILRQRMLDAYTDSVQWEFRFASSLFNSTPVTSEDPKFTDLTPLIAPETQELVINHPLYMGLARGTLPLSKYEELNQQDYLYMRGFYGAFESMENKEADLKLKAKLLKNPEPVFTGFEDQFKEFNFEDAVSTAAYTLDYMRHETGTARDRPVGEGIASVYPCYFLWDIFGYKMVEIAKSMHYVKHPYQSFIDIVNPANNVGSLEKAETLLNTYYSKETLEGKQRMLQLIRQSIMHELQFANGIYGQLHVS